ncbi:MAG TPA: M67 family metallopeptidase [Thermoanaerobaculia bacterium]|nr:M67 family metallopeptidase [Thermoanaerobaculia bacterium]
MTRIALAADQLASLTRHARLAYPEEGCGILLGRATAEAAAAVVEELVLADNERADSRHNRYVIAPQTVLAAHRKAREGGLDVVGYFHSHPDCPAVPSDFDREHAWPGLSYVIVSVCAGDVAEVRSWRLADDRERFHEETLETLR